MASILLSEEDPDVRRLLAILLERLGHEVASLDAGDEFELEALDLVVLEPAGREGLSHVRMLRGERSDLPILCVSVLPEEARHLEIGPLTYLAKPFALDELRDAVDRTLALAFCS